MTALTPEQVQGFQARMREARLNALAVEDGAVGFEPRRWAQVPKAVDFAWQAFEEHLTTCSDCSAHQVAAAEQFVLGWEHGAQIKSRRAARRN